MNSKRVTLAGIFISALFCVFPLSASALVNTSELHILPDGSLSAKSVVVFQKAGSNFFCRVAWGDTFIRMTVLVHTDTEITKKFGGKGTVDDIKEGDTIEISGLLSDGTGNLVVKAKKVRNVSVTKESKAISGTITRIDTASSTAVVTVKDLGSVKAVLSEGGIIQKGKRTIGLSELRVGDTLLGASGVFDFSTLTLTTSLFEIHQDKKEFLPQTFSGTIVSFAGTTLPASVVVASRGKNYTVYLSESSKVMRKSREVVALTRMAVGDSVLIYGSIRETNLSEISAISIRDLAF